MKLHSKCGERDSLSNLPETPNTPGARFPFFRDPGSDLASGAEAWLVIKIASRPGTHVVRYAQRAAVELNSIP